MTGRIALIFAFAAGLATEAAAGSGQPAGPDELVVSYPDRSENAALPYMILTFRNDASEASAAGSVTLATDHGPVTVQIDVDTGPETLTVTDWPPGMWPVPPQIRVPDGSEGHVEFDVPMM